MVKLPQRAEGPAVYLQRAKPCLSHSAKSGFILFSRPSIEDRTCGTKFFALKCFACSLIMSKHLAALAYQLAAIMITFTNWLACREPLQFQNLSNTSKPKHQNGQSVIPMAKASFPGNLDTVRFQLAIQNLMKLTITFAIRFNIMQSSHSRKSFEKSVLGMELKLMSVTFGTNGQ